MQGVSRLYVDANIVIHLVEHRDCLAEALVDLFIAQQEGAPFLVTSELTLTEVLIGPCKDKDDQLLERYDAALTTNTQLEVAAVTRDVLWRAAILRSHFAGLKTPDAIHASTAIVKGCSHLLTADKRFPDQIGLTRLSYGPAGGPATIEVLRPELEIVQQLKEIASR